MGVSALVKQMGRLRPTVGKGHTAWQGQIRGAEGLLTPRMGLVLCTPAGGLPGGGVSVLWLHTQAAGGAQSEPCVRGRRGFPGHQGQD